MSRQFNKIGIIGKHGDPNRGGTLSDLLAYFGKHEAAILLDKKSLGSAVENSESYSFVDRQTMGESCDLIIVVGGDGTLLNAEIIAHGYGFAYTRFPFSKMEEFRELERKAREAGRGLWGDGDGKGADYAQRNPQ